MLAAVVPAGAAVVDARVRVTGGGAGGAAAVDAVDDGVATGRSWPSRSSPVEPSSATLAIAAAAAMAATANPIETGRAPLAPSATGAHAQRPRFSDRRPSPRGV